VIVYYYAKYERTIWRNLQQKYPGVCTEADIEVLFDPARSVDLYYDVVRSSTEWPTRDFSIKTLAKFLAFEWRDVGPSGAASIEWFDRWAKTGDLTIRERIIDYNEDDLPSNAGAVGRDTRLTVSSGRLSPPGQRISRISAGIPGQRPASSF
jgi:predicted RecB family nuclease